MKWWFRFAGLKTKTELVDGVIGVAAEQPSILPRKAAPSSPAKLSRRGFLGVLGVAAGGAALVDPERGLWRPGARLISIPRPVAIDQHWCQEFAVDADDLTLSFEEFGWRYVEPAVEALANAVDRFVLQDYRRVRFERLVVPPHGMGRVIVGPMGRLPEARVVVAYDVVSQKPGWVGRVDCLVKGG